jgi:hypothetical protein
VRSANAGLDRDRAEPIADGAHAARLVAGAPRRLWDSRPARSRSRRLARAPANLFITDIEPQPFRVRYRLVGTKAVRTIGFDITGRYLDELLSATPEVPWIDYYKTVYDSRAPLLGAVEVSAQSGGTFAYEFGLFPLAQGGPAVAQIAAVEDYFDFDLTAAQLVARPGGSGTGSSDRGR